MPLVGARRTSITPNGTMTTLASPTLGGASASLWLVEMTPGATGPEHAFAGEVIWAVTQGGGTAVVEGVEHDLSAGVTLVIPGGAMRTMTAGPDGFHAVASTPAPGTVTRADGLPTGVPPWVA